MLDARVSQAHVENGRVRQRVEETAAEAAAFEIETDQCAASVHFFSVVCFFVFRLFKCLNFHSKTTRLMAQVEHRNARCGATTQTAFHVRSVATQSSK